MWVFVSAVIGAFGCAPPALDDDEGASGLLLPGDSGPTMDDCAAWMADQHDPVLPTVCSEQSGEPDWRAEIVAAGAVVYPLSADRHATVWLPAVWEPRDTLLYIVHNTDGCGGQRSALWDLFSGSGLRGAVP